MNHEADLTAYSGGGGGVGGAVLPYFSYIPVQCMCRLGFRATQSLNRVSFLALWSFDRVSKSQALLKT